jgi:hypothetical protein
MLNVTDQGVEYYLRGITLFSHQAYSAVRAQTQKVTFKFEPRFCQLIMLPITRDDLRKIQKLDGPGSTLGTNTTALNHFIMAVIPKISPQFTGR